MITAKEARERAQMSNDAVDKFIEAIGKKIEEAVVKGEFEYRYSGHSPFDPTKSEQLSMLEYMPFDVPEFWKLAIAKLKAYPNNYGVTVERGETYVPRGLANDDNTGPEYVSYTMLISW